MMKKWHEIVTTAAIILILLLLSFALLKLPKLYFGHSDEKLNGVVSIGAYDINNEIKSMSMAQVLDVFEKEDVLMVEEEAPVLDKELFENLISGSLREFLLMIFDKDYEYYAYMLTDLKGEVSYAGSACTILEMENDEIYSVRVGTLSMEYMYDTIYYRIDLLFNLDTCDILGIMLNDMSRNPYEVNFWLCLDTADMVCRNLNQYYGIESSWDNLWNGGIQSNYLRLVPFDDEAETKRVLRTLSSHLYENGYQYVDLTEITEMLQE